jgi:ribonucleoside-diphosphate reductase alpha chain
MGSRFLSKEDRDALGILGGVIVAEAPEDAAPMPDLASVGAAGEDHSEAALPPASSTSSGRAGGDRPATSSSPTAARASAAGSGALAGNDVVSGNGNGSGFASLGVGQRVAFSVSADSPSCMDCGSIMVRSGSCYKCLNCGATSGCS